MQKDKVGIPSCQVKSIYLYRPVGLRLFFLMFFPLHCHLEIAHGGNYIFFQTLPGAVLLLLITM